MMENGVEGNSVIEEVGCLPKELTIDRKNKNWSAEKDLDKMKGRKCQLFDGKCMGGGRGWYAKVASEGGRYWAVRKDDLTTFRKQQRYASVYSTSTN